MMKIKKKMQLMWNTKKVKEHLCKITILKQFLMKKKQNKTK